MAGQQPNNNASDKPSAAMRLLLWLTAPSLLKGIALGTVLAVVAFMTVQIDALWYVASGLMLLVVSLLVGAIIGHYLYEHHRRKLQSQAGQSLHQAGEAFQEFGGTFLQWMSRRDEALIPQIQSKIGTMGPLAKRASQLGIAFVFRVMAFSTLLAVLGGVVSFAVFLASYMQVERMGEQNTLLEAQTELLHQQSDVLREQNAMIKAQLRDSERSGQVRIALNIANQRQAMVRSLISALASEVDQVRRTPDIIRPDAPNHPRRHRNSVRLSDGTYARILSTFTHLAPYRGLDPESQDLDATASSPEQAELLRFLLAMQIDLHDLELGVADLRHASLRYQEFNISNPDLSESNLSLADFSSAQFGKTRLAGANLQGTNVTLASMQGIDLHDADLRGAIVTRTDLQRANLLGALLQDADLRQAELSRANLSEADLSGADLALADFRQTNITAGQVQKARNWWLARYDDELSGELGMTPDLQATVLKASNEASRLNIDEPNFAEYFEALAKRVPDPGTP